MINVIVFDFSGVVFTNGLPIAIKRIQSKFNIEEIKFQDALNGNVALAYRPGKQSLIHFLVLQQLEKILKIYSLMLIL